MSKANCHVLNIKKKWFALIENSKECAFAFTQFFIINSFSLFLLSEGKKERKKGSKKEKRKC
jgi:hypothetical protein